MPSFTPGKITCVHHSPDSSRPSTLRRDNHQADVRVLLTIWRWIFACNPPPAASVRTTGRDPVLFGKRFGDDDVVEHLHEPDAAFVAFARDVAEHLHVLLEKRRPAPQQRKDNLSASPTTRTDDHSTGTACSSDSRRRNRDTPARTPCRRRTKQLGSVRILRKPSVPARCTSSASDARTAQCHRSLSAKLAIIDNRPSARMRLANSKQP